MESKRIGPRPGWDYYPIIIAKQLRGTIDKKAESQFILINLAKVVILS
jgi:hypothetical protein